jgi:chromosome segregation ATPase
LSTTNASEQHTCEWQGCGATLATAGELADHLSTHTPAAAGRRHSVAASAAWSSQSADGSRTLDFLTGELEASRAQNTELRKQLAQVKANNEELRSSAKTTEAQRAQILAESRGELNKQLEDAKAEIEEKRQAEEEHEARRQAAQTELDGVREELDKRVEEVAELEAMVKATEVELMKRNTTIEGLEATVTELETKVAAGDDSGASAGTAVTLPPDAPAEDQIKERDAIIAALRKDLKRSKKAHKTTKGDLEFIREQYETASSSAVQEVNRAKELQAQVDKLREQLTLGLKQRDLFNKAAVDAATVDTDKARQQVALLLEQNRRTDDSIRRKAAQHHQLSKEKHELEVDLHKERTRAHELSKRNDELVAQVSQLRGRLMGVYDKVDESDDDEPAYAMPTLVPDDNRVACPAADPTLAAEAAVWQCKWLVDDRLCGLYFDTREVRIVPD